MQAIQGYTTHQAPLINAVLHTEGAVLEMGCGDFSTPILHELCRQKQRQLITCDSNPVYLKRFTELSSAWHQLVLVTNWDSIIGKFGVVFIDHDTERRVVDLRRLKQVTDVFVVHDSEKQRWYKYGDSFSTFKYRYDYILWDKKTSLLSDIIDVNTFFL